MHNTHNNICTPSTPSPSSSLLLCSRLVLHFISSSTLCSPSSRLIMLFVPLPPVLLSSRALNLAAVSFLRHHFVPSYHALSFSLSVRSIMSSPSLPFCCDSVTLLLCLRRGCCVPVLLISSFVTFFLFSTCTVFFAALSICFFHVHSLNRLATSIFFLLLSHLLSTSVRVAPPSHPLVFCPFRER